MQEKLDTLDCRQCDVGFVRGRIPADAKRIPVKPFAFGELPQHKKHDPKPTARVVMKALCLLLFPMILSADTLILKSGQQVSGTYAGGDARSIRFAVGDQIKTFAVGDVVQMLLDNKESAGGWRPVEQPSKAQNERQTVSTPVALGQQAPAQTRFVLRGDEAFDTQSNLAWKRCPVGRTWQGGQCVGEAGWFTWQQAAEYRDGEWRAPTLEEIDTLWEEGGRGNGDRPHVDVNSFQKSRRRFADASQNHPCL